jgi:transcriptional regulator with XRE-family HTH domain
MHDSASERRRIPSRCGGSQLDKELSRKIGERLRMARTVQGLSLSQLSALTDGALLKSRISNFEQGIRRPSVEVAVMLADVLQDVSPAYLLCLDIGSDDELSPDETRLLHRFRKADARGRATLLAVAAQQATHHQAGELR